MSKTVKGVRLVAVLEAAKGMIVFLAGFGMLSFIHEYHRDPVAVLIKHFHINHNHYPRIFLEVADSLADIRLWALAALAASYTIMRLIEAYGLWNGRRWAEWFAVASGAIYMPFEIYELMGGISWLKISALAINIIIVAYLAHALWKSRQDPARPSWNPPPK